MLIFAPRDDKMKLAEFLGLWGYEGFLLKGE